MITVPARLKALGFETSSDVGRRLLSTTDLEVRAAFVRDVGHQPRRALTRKENPDGSRTVCEYPRTYRDRIDEIIKRVAQALNIKKDRQASLF